jgi:hypothetical protein
MLDRGNGDEGRKEFPISNFQFLNHSMSDRLAFSLSSFLLVSVSISLVCDWLAEVCDWVRMGTRDGK